MGLTTWIDFGLTLVILGLFIYVLLRSTVAILHKVYLLFHLVLLLWPVCQFLTTITDNPQIQLSYLKLSFASLSLLGGGALVLVLFLARQSYVISRSKLVWLCTPAAVVAVLVIINPGDWFVRAIDGSYLDRIYGPLFWVQVIGSLSYMGFAIGHGMKLMKAGLPRQEKLQLRFAVWGFSLISVFAVLDILCHVLLKGLLPPVTNLTSTGIALSSILFVLAIAAYRNFDLVQFAQQNIMNSINLGVLVLDDQDVVLETNAVLTGKVDAVVGERWSIERYIARMAIEGDKEQFLAAYRNPLGEQAKLEIINGFDGLSHVEMQSVPLVDPGAGVIGHVITFHNVSELRKLVEESKRQNTVLQQRNRELILIQDELYQANRKLEKLAITDSLTGCYNRRYLMQQLEYEVMMNARYHIPFAIILFDIDLFKSINDLYGHVFGDEVIRSTAEAVARTLRKTDILARYGGEEFTVYLPHTNLQQAQVLAERIKSVVEHNEIPSNTPQAEAVTVTISMGVLAVEESSGQVHDNPGAYVRALFAQADAALYIAKNGGRNRIVNAELA